MRNTTVDVLVRARALLAQGWTQKEEARNADGRDVPATSANAVCWCITGALWRAQEHRHGSIGLGPLYDALHDRNYSSWIANWNDKAGRTHSEVLELMDEAIWIAERQAVEHL